MKQTAKKILSFILCLALSLGAVAVPALAASNLLGDVNGDKAVTTADARLALRAAVGLDTLSAGEKTAADVIGDGEVKTDDARIILRVAVGLMRLSKDGKRYEDIPTHGDILAAYITENGVYTDDGETVYFGYDYGDVGYAVISYTKKAALPFEVYCYESYDGIEMECAMQFSKSFSTFEAQAAVFDEDYLYAQAEYDVTDTRNLNPNTGASCFKETSYEGDPELKKEIPTTMAILISTALSLLVRDLKADGVDLTKEDMNLNRVTESYKG